MVINLHPKLKYLYQTQVNVWGKWQLKKYKHKKWLRFLRQPVLFKLLANKRFKRRLKKKVLSYKTLYKTYQQEYRKLNYFYGYMSKYKFVSMYRNALKKKHEKYDGQLFLNILERRIDIVLVRMNILPVIFLANQLLKHKKILINDEIVKNPNMLVKPGDIITIIPTLWQKVFRTIKYRMLRKQLKIPYPPYVYVSFNIMKGIYVNLPSTFKDIYYPMPIQYNFIKHFCNKL